MPRIGHRRLLLALVAACALAACASPAWAARAPALRAHIVLDKSIYGVSPGMSAAQVKHRLGRPSDVYHSPGTEPYDSWAYGRGRSYGRVTLLFPRHGRKLAPAAIVGTLVRREHTANGIHLGITLAQLRARVPGLFCAAAGCFTHDPSKYDGIVTHFRLERQRSRTVLTGLQLFRSTPPKPRAPTAPAGPRPAAEGGPNVSRDFQIGCPCFPGLDISFEADPPAHPDQSYALVAVYHWDFGDGGTYDGGYDSRSASHRYAQPGTYTVTLTMTDEDGSRWTVTKAVEVRAPRPASESDNPNVPRTFTVSCSNDTCQAGGDSSVFFALDHPEYDPSRYDPSRPTAAVVGWDFGDGTTLADGSATANHSYASPGTYVVTVTVTDGQDEWVISSAISLNG